MKEHEFDAGSFLRPRCCPQAGFEAPGDGRWTVTRRTFLKGMGAATLGGVALSGLSWPALLAAAPEEEGFEIRRRPLRAKPVLIYSLPERQRQTSWRNWGGIQTRQDSEGETARIREELAALGRRADFPLEFLPVSTALSAADIAGISDLPSADVIIAYAAGGWLDSYNALGDLKKDVIFFCRHKSGPVYLWYEIISPRHLRQGTDRLVLKGVDDEDVVIDSQDEILWRLRSLAGLRSTLGTRVVCIGGPNAWSQPEGNVPNLVAEKWQFDMPTIPYEELGRLIREARSDVAAVRQARADADAYLGSPGTTLETERAFVVNAFLLARVFRGLMKAADCRAITVNSCMGTIMPLAETSACLTLSLLNDAGYLAFCESDFVVIPSGVLLANISGKPVFLNDPTYPHDGIITIAHCTAPRRMNGREPEPARILTHFESDYGAAPKVEMRKGQFVTNIAPDFASKRWLGLGAEIVEAPFLPICRSQVDVRFACDSLALAKRMPGFHWMTGYGDYLRELGYALKRVGIDWERLA
jgi:hypothetical protein